MYEDSGAARKNMASAISRAVAWRRIGMAASRSSRTLSIDLPGVRPGVHDPSTRSRQVAECALAQQERSLRVHREHTIPVVGIERCHRPDRLHDRGRMDDDVEASRRPRRSSSPRTVRTARPWRTSRGAPSTTTPSIRSSPGCCSGRGSPAARSQTRRTAPPTTCRRPSCTARPRNRVSSPTTWTPDTSSSSPSHWRRGGSRCHSSPS
jgi:hypothetical protein